MSFGMCVYVFEIIYVYYIYITNITYNYICVISRIATDNFCLGYFHLFFISKLCIQISKG